MSARSQRVRSPNFSLRSAHVELNLQGPAVCVEASVVVFGRSANVAGCFGKMCDPRYFRALRGSGQLHTLHSCTAGNFCSLIPARGFNVANRWLWCRPSFEQVTSALLDNSVARRNSRLSVMWNWPARREQVPHPVSYLRCLVVWNRDMGKVDLHCNFGGTFVAMYRRNLPGRRRSPPLSCLRACRTQEGCFSALALLTATLFALVLLVLRQSAFANCDKSERKCCTGPQGGMAAGTAAQTRSNRLAYHVAAPVTQSS